MPPEQRAVHSFLSVRMEDYCILPIRQEPQETLLVDTDEDTLGKVARAKGADMESLLSQFSAPVPLRRVSTPDEMAGVCVFLASEDASFMTGAVLVVDGGAIIVDVAGVSGD